MMIIKYKEKCTGDGKKTNKKVSEIYLIYDCYDKLLYLWLITSKYKKVAKLKFLSNWNF